MDCVTKLCDVKQGPVIVRGWVENVRKGKKYMFVLLRDGVGKQSHVQVVVPKSVATTVTCESYVEISGVVKDHEVGQYSCRPFEIEASSVKVIGESSGSFASKCPSDAGADVKLEQRHLYIRDPKFALITKLRAVLVRALRDHFEETGCTEIFPPSFVGNQCEGGSTLFSLQYPARDTGDMPAYLTQSSQFYLEYTLPALGDTYCIAPSFRAERSQTRRHLTEFLHAECEWSGIMSFGDHLAKLRALMIGTVSRFLEYGKDYLIELGEHIRVTHLLEMCHAIRTLTHEEAIVYCREHEIYKDEETKTHFDFTDDIPEMQERKMIDQMGSIVFLTQFPKHFKSFYFDTFENGLTLSCDIECPNIGEVVGSGVRAYDPEVLEKAIIDNGLKVEDYKEYIELRKFGPGRTSGMGLGVDRFLSWLLGTHSIRDVVTFPRYPGKLTP